MKLRTLIGGKKSTLNQAYADEERRPCTVYTPMWTMDRNLRSDRPTHGRIWTTMIISSRWTEDRPAL